MLRAHPYDDLDVVDARAPRFVQGTVAIGCAVTLVTGWWPILALLALQLVVGLTLGRRYCLPCVLYFEVVQPRIGEGEIEDARPPRFANILGATFLTAATLLYALDATAAAVVVTALVLVLATLASSTGLCVGCEFYRLVARMRGVRPGHLDRVDLEELGAVRGEGELVVHFTHPLCTGCREVEERVTRAGRNIVRVDISAQPDLAPKYHVSVVPTTVSVDPGGRVLERIA